MRRVVLLVVVGVLLVMASLGLWYRSFLVTPAPGEGAVVLTIARGAGVRSIGSQLAAQGLLNNDIRFLVLVALSGKRGTLKAGEYRIVRGLTPPQILDLLTAGSNLRHQVTIPEGLTMAQVAELFARDGWIKPPVFLALSRDPSFIRQLGIEAASLEGYLFPETYTLIRDEVSEERVLRMMVERFRQVWREVGVPENAHGLNRHQVLILASMVEKETGVAQERPLIARVFLNRLQRKMRLQSDPTVIFGLVNFNGDLTRADLLRQTPYNTYTIPALPAGPICNPGRAAVEAVLHPADSEALYFVSRNDGTHAFSASLEEHNRAVHQYQLSR